MIIAISEREILSISNDQELGETIRSRYFEAKSREKDRCVVCGRVSPYDAGVHIDMRVGYVEGGGQGCFQPQVCGHP
jgi:hypothetical protein